jgi:hypothetical protein
VWLVHAAALEHRLGERDRHLGVVGVGAAAEARVEHLEALGQRPRWRALERHAERVPGEGAEQRAARAVKLPVAGHGERMPSARVGGEAGAPSGRQIGFQSAFKPARSWSRRSWWRRIL